jgi:hypothetical protein
MGLVKQVEIRSLQSFKGGNAQFFTPQPSDQTMLVQIPGGTIDDLFVHRHQTDQLLVVRGSFVLVILQNRRYEYIALSDRAPLLVTIPPGVLHGAINLGESCHVVNAVRLHGAPDDRDYQPRPQPFPYDLDRANRLLKSLA